MRTQPNKKHYPKIISDEVVKRVEINYWKKHSVLKNLLWINIFRNWGFTLRHPVWAFHFAKYILHLRQEHISIW